jgi:hypothetical protein
MKNKARPEIKDISTSFMMFNGSGDIQKEDALPCSASGKDGSSGKIYCSCAPKFQMPDNFEETRSEETFPFESEQESDSQDSIPSNIHSLLHNNGPNLGVARKIKKSSKPEHQKAQCAQQVSIRDGRNRDTVSRVEKLRNMYLTGKLRYIPKHRQSLIIQPLKLSFLTAMYMTIPPTRTFRVLNYVFDYDSSVLRLQIDPEEFLKFFGNMRLIKRITSFVYDQGKRNWCLTFEERDPGLTAAHNFEYFGPCIDKWLDGLSNATAQVFKKWIHSKINASSRICAEAIKTIDLAPSAGRKLWLKKLKKETKDWLNTGKWVCRQSMMTTHDSQYSVQKMTVNGNMTDFLGFIPMLSDKQERFSIMDCF